jgi:hypothetical protein
MGGISYICRSVMVPSVALPSWEAQQTEPLHSGRHTGHLTTHYMIYSYHPIRFVFQVNQKDLRSSLIIADYCRNMEEPVYKGVVKISAYCWLFLLRLIMHGTNIKHSLESIISCIRIATIKQINQYTCIVYSNMQIIGDKSFAELQVLVNSTKILFLAGRYHDSLYLCCSVFSYC